MRSRNAFTAADAVSEHSAGAGARVAVASFDSQEEHA